jgi:hypothetical protein
MITYKFVPHPIRIARHKTVVLVHQDVCLHSGASPEAAARRLSDGSGHGLLGACGIDASGSVVGRMRDRICLLGRPLTGPCDVDSVDEVLFMAPRALLLDEPLTEAPELAWHAYAVEYGLRVRARGLRVGATRIPSTHNSLSGNLASLGAAHAAIARTHPEACDL